MNKHYAVFYSPGTFVSEESWVEIDGWDVYKAVELSRGIKERHGATPYGFQFKTKERGDEDLDSRVVETSAMYYLGGEVFTLRDIEQRADPKEHTLLWNMRVNGVERVIINNNSWKFTAPLLEGDVILDY